MGFSPILISFFISWAHHLSVQNFRFCRAPWRMGLSPILISRFVSGAHHLSVQNFHFCRTPWRMGFCPFSLAGSHRRNENTVLLAAKTHPLSARLDLAGTLLHIYAAADRDMPRQATMRPAARFSAAKAKKRPRRKIRRERFFALFRIPLYAIRPWGRPQPAPCLPRCPRT